MRFISRITHFFAGISYVCCILLVLITLQQVIARYFFSSSSTALQELQWHLFGIIFLFSSAHALNRNEHVRVDIFYSRLSERKKALIDLMGTLFFIIPTCLVVIFYGWSYTMRAREFPTSTPSDYYCKKLVGASTPAFDLCFAIERPVRKYVLVGEQSPDPGGLEARWIIKSVIPFAFALLLLQALTAIPGFIIQIMGKCDGA